MAGPEGCTLYGFVAGEGSAYEGNREEWEKLLADQGAEMLPVPTPKRLPPWWKAKRVAPVTLWVDE